MSPTACLSLLSYLLVITLARHHKDTSTLPDDFVLFVSLPLRGHFNPLATLAKRMKDEGYHPVFVVANVTFPSKRMQWMDVKVIEEEGLDSIGSPDVYCEPLPNAPPTGVPSLAVIMHVMTCIAQPVWRESLRVVEEVILGKKPQLILYGEVVALVSHMASRYGVPAVMITPHVHPLLMFHSEPFNVPDGAVGSAFDQNTFLGRAKVVGVRLGLKIFKQVINYLVASPVCAEFNFSSDCFDIENSIYGSEQLILNILPYPLTIPHLKSPSVITVGPFIEKTEFENEEWQRWVQDRKEGIILFSMGSLLNLTREESLIIVDALREVAEERDLHVLWARGKKLFSDQEIPDPGPRFTLAGYIPQIYILHQEINKVKLFISHCGAGGASEALNSGTPILCIPFVADQLFLANILKSWNISDIVYRADMTKDSAKKQMEYLLDSVNIYRDYAAMRDIVKSQGGLDTAMLHIKALISAGNAKHLTPPVINWHWFFYYSFDVFIVGILVIFVVGWLCWKLCRCACRCCCGCCSKKEKKD